MELIKDQRSKIGPARCKQVFQKSMLFEEKKEHNERLFLLTSSWAWRASMVTFLSCSFTSDSSLREAKPFKGWKITLLIWFTFPSTSTYFLKRRIWKTFIDNSMFFKFWYNHYTTNLVSTLMVDLNLMSSSVRRRSRALWAITSSCRLQCIIETITLGRCKLGKAMFQSHPDEFKWLFDAYICDQTVWKCKVFLNWTFFIIYVQ